VEVYILPHHPLLIMVEVLLEVEQRVVLQEVRFIQNVRVAMVLAFVLDVVVNVEVGKIQVII